MNHNNYREITNQYQISRTFNSEYDSIMVHFLAIESIKENQYQYLEPKDYTQILAAFQHTIHMIVLHHCFDISENHQPGNQERERQELEVRDLGLGPEPSARKIM